MNKKGQVLENFGTIAISVATFAIIIVIAFLVLSQTKTVSIDFVDGTGFVNQTNTVTLEIFTELNSHCIDEQDLVVTGLVNASTNALGGTNVELGNITVSGKTVNITEGLGTGFSSTINISYSCKMNSNAINATEELQNATASIPGWIPLVVLILIGMLILGMISNFGR